jgi:hypothetical protein
VEAISAEHWSGPASPWIEGALPLRYPLLADLILPELLQGYRERRPH